MELFIARLMRFPSRPDLRLDLARPPFHRTGRRNVLPERDDRVFTCDRTPCICTDRICADCENLDRTVLPSTVREGPSAIGGNNHATRRLHQLERLEDGILKQVIPGVNRTDQECHCYEL